MGDGLGDDEGDGDGLGEGEGDGVGEAAEAGEEVDGALPGSGEEDAGAAGVCEPAAPPAVGRGSKETCDESMPSGPVAQPAMAASTRDATSHPVGFI